MKTAVKSLFILVLGLLMTNCKSQKEVMNSWIGYTENDLVKNWGPPTKRDSDGAGGEILVYATQERGATTSFASSDGYTTSRTGNNYWIYRMFYVNEKKEIYFWRIQKEQIHPMEIDLTVYHRY